MTKTFFINVCPLSHEGSISNLALIGHAVSETKKYGNNGHKHVYSPQAGSDNNMGSNVFQKKNLLSIWPFAARCF